MVELWLRLGAAVSGDCWLNAPSWRGSWCACSTCVSHLSVAEQTPHHHHQLQDIMSLPLRAVLICSPTGCWCSYRPHVHLGAPTTSVCENMDYNYRYNLPPQHPLWLHVQQHRCSKVAMSGQGSASWIMGISGPKSVERKGRFWS